MAEAPTATQLIQLVYSSVIFSFLSNRCDPGRKRGSSRLKIFKWTTDWAADLQDGRTGDVHFYIHAYTYIRMSTSAIGEVNVFWLQTSIWYLYILTYYTSHDLSLSSLKRLEGTFLVGRYFYKKHRHGITLFLHWFCRFDYLSVIALRNRFAANLLGMSCGVKRLA